MSQELISRSHLATEWHKKFHVWIKYLNSKGGGGGWSPVTLFHCCGLLLLPQLYLSFPCSDALFHVRCCCTREGGRRYEMKGGTTSAEESVVRESGWSLCCFLATSAFDVAESLKVGDASQLHVGAHYTRLACSGNRIHFYTGPASFSQTLCPFFCWEPWQLKRQWSVISKVIVMQKDGVAD